MTTEQWRPIPGWKSYYSASSIGRIRSEPRVIERGGKPMRVRKRILKSSPHPAGHLTTRLTRNGKSETQFVHRLVLSAFSGPCPPGMECRHLNGDPADNRIENLRWGTSSENTMDLVGHGNHLHARQTHCKRGHKLSTPNLVRSSSRKGYRNCLACARAKSYLSYYPERKHQIQPVSDSYFDQIMKDAA